MGDLKLLYVLGHLFIFTLPNMIKNRYIFQKNYDGNWNGYSQWSHGTFESWNSGKLIGVWSYKNMLYYRI